MGRTYTVVRVAAPAWLDELNFDAGPPWVSMGTRALSTGLFVRDADFDRDLAWKAELLATRHDDVFAALDTAEVRAASEEVAALTGAPTTAGRHPLDAAGRAVQEDLCVLVLRDGAPHLDAASLCFPSYWRLADKIGRPLREVHGPVPHYADELATKVDGFVQRLAPGRMAWRRNWSIHDDPAYFLPVAGAPGGDALYLRSERQVLARLHSTNAVLFTIRTQQVPLETLAYRPDIARRMADAIDGWSAELIGYKGGHGALRAGDWLRSL
jgi:dimethylamine monooxygenase subunit A